MTATIEEICQMTDAEQIAYLESHPKQKEGLDRLLADIEREDEEPERWDGME